MIVSIKINDSVISQSFDTYKIEREVSKVLSQHHRICDDCAHNFSCEHYSLDDESIKRGFAVGKRRPLVFECDDFSSFYSRNNGPEVPLTDDMITERYATAFSASIAHLIVRSSVQHMR